MPHVPVLIVGGGPVGLTLAIDLAWRGIACLLVEERTEPTTHPKATLLGARSMELFRRFDRLDEKIADAAIRQDDDYFIVFTDRLAGHELSRFRSPGLAAIRARRPETVAKFRELQWSRYGKTQIGQPALEPVLLAEARRRGVAMRHGWRVGDVIDRGRHVEARITRDGATETITADHAVACDGGASAVRKALGIRMGGRGRMRSNVSYYFRAPDFLSCHGKGLANLYFTFQPDSFGVFTAINGRDLWSYQYYWADPNRTPDTDDPATVLHRAMGKAFAFELLGTTHWHHHQSVAASWRQGRIFLAGDAAHLFVPTGGVGMNTGIGDACDLAWKLAATRQGWGREWLLDSYEAERKPIAFRNSVVSANNSDRIDLVMSEAPATISDGTAEAEAARAVLAGKIRWMARQFNSAGVHLGYRYADSPIVAPDGTPEPPDDPNQVVPSAWPGSRAPHVDLPDGRALADLFGQDFALLRFGADAPALRAALRGVPLADVPLDHPEAAALYAAPLVLIRPDGHVAWRGDADPADAAAVVARVTGAVPPEHLRKVA